MKKALILVDIQNDFIPGGALEVRRGDEVVEVANRAMKHFDHIMSQPRTGILQTTNHSPVSMKGKISENSLNCNGHPADTLA